MKQWVEGRRLCDLEPGTPFRYRFSTGNLIEQVVTGGKNLPMDEWAWGYDPETSQVCQWNLHIKVEALVDLGRLIVDIPAGDLFMVKGVRWRKTDILHMGVLPDTGRTCWFPQEAQEDV